MALMKHLEEDIQKQDERVRRLSDTIVKLFNKNHKQDRYAKLLSMAHAKDHYFVTELASNKICFFFCWASEEAAIMVLDNNGDLDQMFYFLFDRVTVPLLKMTAQLLASGVYEEFADDEQ